MSWADKVLALGPEYGHWSTLTTGEDLFRYVLERAARDAGGRLKNVLEIGTHYGVSAFCLSHYADSIYTCDAEYYTQAGRLFSELGIDGKISTFWNFSDDNKRDLAACQEWDLVYIDGDHREAGTWADWLAVKDHARAVLMHDYGDKRPGIEGPTRVVERSGVHWQIDIPFAYWRRDVGSD